MVFKTGVVSGAVVLALGCIGCDGVQDLGPADFDLGDDTPAIQARSLEANTWKLNTWKLNTWKLNGWKLNTSRLYAPNNTDYIQLTKTEAPDGWPANSAQLVGGMLKVDGFTEWDVEDTTFHFQVKEGAATITKKAWLKYAYKVYPFTDVWEYDYDLQIGLSNQALCVDDNGNQTKALMLADVWDPDTGDRVTPRPEGAITFACKNGALAKCVLFGYRPWASKNGTPLADYHQACTRMVRADYCGDGTTHTTTGTAIHVLDQIGIQNADPNVSYQVEAEWGPDGAVCLNPGNTRHPVPALGCDIPTCGAPFASGGLIQSGKIVP